MDRRHVTLPMCIHIIASLMITYGEYLQCTDFKKYGKQCENLCPQTCLNSTCKLIKSRVVCTEGCVTGKKGGKCGVECPGSCTQCEQYSDKCIGPCKHSLYYGDSCEMLCSSGCRDGCNKTGVCFSCKSGYRGKFCNETCPQFNEDCEFHTIKYMNNCVVIDYYGDRCDKTCHGHCRDGCNRTTGICDDCADGYKGEPCTVSCLSTCTQCERYGDMCVGPCASPQYYGGKCDKVCSANCTNGCGKDTGVCNSCATDQIGRYCNETCPDGCTDGCDRGECINAKTPKRDTLKIVGCVLLSIALTGGLLFVILLLWRRKRLKELANDGEIPDNRVLNSETQILSDKLGNLISPTNCHVNLTYGLTKDQELKFVTYCDDLLTEDSELNVAYIMNEFTSLPPPNSGLVKCASHGDNLSKNRYRDVLPFDETRVFLETDGAEEPDYINASYINGYRNQIRYVAAQGPSLQVIDDFWRMIWQLNTTKVVMLTNLVEAGKVKCEMYWPFCGSESQSYGKVCVQCMEEKVHKYYTLRTLAVWKGKATTRTIRQFHFTDWPDHGVPEDTKSIIDFHRVVKDTEHNALGPMVIHCSAGVGRSGTFIALDYLLDQAMYEGSVCIFKCIQNFRLQRMKMVQTKEQYKFVYDMLASALQYRGTLPRARYYHPVLLQCEMCCDKKNTTESSEEESSVEENDQEYQPLWNCGLENRESFLPRHSNPLTVFAIISEDSPPLLRSPIDMEQDSETDNDMEKQRISCDTAL